MTALQELKQKMKNFYGEHDTFILPVLKFLLAIITFRGINASLGFMHKLDNIFVVLILSILCSVLPLNLMVILGLALIVAHCYAVGVEVAGFALLLIILLMILFLRFSSKDNLALILTPVAFGLRVPAIVPIGCGLLRGPASAISADCGVIIYYFMNLVKEKASVLKGETDIMQKLKFLLDGLVKNQNMWLTVLAFTAVIILVYVIRKMAVDYSWRIAIVVGAVIYIVTMVAGGLFLDVTNEMAAVIISAVGSCILGLILEFFVLGVDYSRSENLQFEDDEYVYYVKAVPKSLVTQSKRSIKKIQVEPEERPERRNASREPDEEEDIPLEKVDFSEFDFEEKLEDSLKDL